MLRPVRLVDTAERPGGRGGIGGGQLEGGTQSRRPKMPVGKVAALLWPKLNVAGRIQGPVGKESGDWGPADRFSGVQAEPHGRRPFCWNEPGWRDGSTP